MSDFSRRQVLAIAGAGFAGAVLPQISLAAGAAPTAATAITEAVFGVALQTVSTGQAVPVETGNGAIVKLTASAAISVGDRLMPGANGKVATAAGATAVDCGVALSAAGADGEIITARLNPMGKSPVNT